VALAVFLARKGADKAEIRRELETRVGYDFSRSLAEIAPTYYFKISCQESVPEAITAFLESVGYEDAVRKAILLGGDADTMACIAGAIAAAHYGEVPEGIRNETLRRLPDDLAEVVEQFHARYHS
jgi:ADP-ribosylglycohydrolase